jgi:hypothetical protein
MPAKVFFILLCSLLTVVVTVMSIDVCNHYYDHRPYGPDPVTGLINNIHAYSEFQQHGRLVAAAKEYLYNTRTPFVQMAVVLVSPGFLKSRYAHLLVSTVLFFTFLLLWSYWMRRQNVPVVLIAAILIAFSSTWKLYSPYAGLAFHLPDAIGGYSLAVGAIALLLWTDTKSLKWLTLFGAMVTISTLTRYIFSVYCFFVFAPIIVNALRRTYIANNFSLAEIFRPLVILSLIVGLPCAYFVIKNYYWNVSYYSVWLDNKQGTLSFNRLYSIKTFLTVYPTFTGRMHWFTLALLVSIQTAFAFKFKSQFSKSCLFTFAWLLLALPIFWTLILGSEANRVSSAFLAAYPLTWFALTSFNSMSRLSEFRTATTAISCIIIGVSLLHIKRSLDIFAADGDLTVNDKEKKLVSVEFANKLKATSKRNDFRIADLSETYLSYSISVEAFLSNGGFVNPDSARYPVELITGHQHDSGKFDKVLWSTLTSHYSVILVADKALEKNADSRVINFCGVVYDSLIDSKSWRSSSHPLGDGTITMFVKER